MLNGSLGGMAASQRSHDGFVFPKRKGRKRFTDSMLTSKNDLSEPADESVEGFNSKILECLKEIQHSQFYKDFLDLWFPCLRLLQVRKDDNKGTRSQSAVLECTLACPVDSDRPSSDGRVPIHPGTCRIQSSENFLDDKQLEALERLCVRDPVLPTKTCIPDQKEQEQVQESLENHTNNKDRNIEEIVCYGLGNFSSCTIARYQMALLLALRDTLQVKSSCCYLFDPNFTLSECQYIREGGMEVILENEEGKRQSTRNTLYYMPHCGKPLYNNLLWANWRPHLLKQCVILGNSFTATIQSLPFKALRAQASYIHRIASYTMEEAVQNNFRFTDVFNDTSIHCFPPDIINDVDSNFWEDNTEPTYDDENLEIIQNKIS